MSAKIDLGGTLLSGSLPSSSPLAPSSAVVAVSPMGALDLRITADSVGMGSGEFAAFDDPVIWTAGDLPSTDTLPALWDPAVDHEEQILAIRRTDVNEKHRRVSEWLSEHKYDALVLGCNDAVSWFTAGGDLGHTLTSDASAVLLYMTKHCRAVVCDNVQSARVFEEELAGLGFQLKERDWFRDPKGIIAELGANRRVATDNGIHGWPNERESLRSLRYVLTRPERQKLRELGRALTREVQHTCMNFVPGETEADLAGHLAHRLIRQGIVPVDLRVTADDRLMRYRQPRFKSAPIRNYAVLTATGQRHGLNATVSRIVSFGPAPEDLRQSHGQASMILATEIFFSRPGATVADVFRRARRIYEKIGVPHEWALDYLGGLTGYSPQEFAFHPDSDFPLRSEMAVTWSVSVGAARSQDTVVMDDRGYELVTRSGRWPTMDVTVKGFPITLPAILERDPHSPPKYRVRRAEPHDHDHDHDHNHVHTNGRLGK